MLSPINMPKFQSLISVISHPPPPYQQMVPLSLTFLKGRVDLSFPLTLTLSLSTKACISNSKYVTNLSTFIILDADIITSQMVYYNKPHTRLMSLGTWQWTFYTEAKDFLKSIYLIYITRFFSDILQWLLLYLKKTSDS